MPCTVWPCLLGRLVRRVGRLLIVMIEVVVGRVQETRHCLAIVWTLETVHLCGWIAEPIP